MNQHELFEEIREYEKYWKQDVCPEFMVEEFIVKGLVRIDASEYNLFEIMENKTIDMLINEGSKQINSHKKGGKLSQLRDGKIVDLSFMVPLYQKLFEKWQKKGWIKLELLEDYTIQIKVCR